MSSSDGYDLAITDARHTAPRWVVARGRVVVSTTTQTTIHLDVEDDR